MSGAAHAVVLDGGALTLERAGDGDKDEVVALQFAAYARNRDLLGLEPLPLLVDYDALFRTHEVWTARDNGRISGALILEVRRDDLLIWSIATEPAQQARGIGGHLIAGAEIRARDLGLHVIRLYTGATLQRLIDWYGRHGFTVERVEVLDDRSITHMAKRLT